MNTTICQFKLASGEQILAEIMELPDSDNDNSFILKNCVEILSFIPDSMEELMMQTQSRGPAYMFRPWLMYQDNEDCLVPINTQQIIASVRPNIDLVDGYYESVFYMQMYAAKRREQLKEERMAQTKQFNGIMEKVKEATGNDDSAEKKSNVIPFPTMHRDS